MAGARDFPEAIQWHEGLLLSPQHFQQFANRQDQILHYHAQLLSPFHWGMRRLQTDPALLVSGTLRVLDLEAVMPDGLVVTHSPTRGQELEIDLTPNAEAMKLKPLAVHLTVPAARRAGGTASELARYDYVSGEPVADEHTGEGEVSIPRLRPRLGLLATEAAPGKFVSFPLAEVAFRNDTFSLTGFVPPCFTVPLQSPTGQMCAQVARRLREKALHLSEKAMSPSLTADSPILHELRSQIQTLVASLPHFEAVLNTGVSHPYPLYLALCSLVGHLASIGVGMVPPVLPAYDHNDIRGSFDAATSYIDRILEHAILTSYAAYPFAAEEGVFRLGMAWQWLTRPMVLGVRAESAMTEKDVLEWMNGALIGSTSMIPSLQQNRVLGADRQRIDRDEDLVPSRGVVLFSLKADPRFIEAGKALLVLNTADRPGRPRPAEIVLYVKNPK
jgi:type VI secretion system protein ImpJ